MLSYDSASLAFLWQPDKELETALCFCIIVADMKRQLC